MKGKKTVGFTMSLLTAAFAAAGVVFYIAGAAGSYYHDTSVSVISVGLISAAAALCPALMAEKWGNDSNARMLQVLSAGGLALALMMILKARVFSIAILLGSTLEASNTAAYVSLYLSLTGMTALVIAIFLCIAACFTKLTAVDKQAG